MQLGVFSISLAVYARRDGKWRITHIHESAYLTESP